MIVDEVIWEIINNGQCSFKTKTETNVFCRNENNVTGLCNRNSCPLANSRYATVIEEKGACYLLIKTVERAHTPKDLWEKIKLDKSYNKALEQIEEQLQYFPEFLKHKCKQRFTRYRQILVRKRKLKLQDTGVYEVVSRKAMKREKSRGKKAEKAALIENHIEQEILNRLKEGKYDEIHNINRKLFERVLNNDEVVDNTYNEVFDEAEYDENVFISDVNKELNSKEMMELDETKISSNMNLSLNEESSRKYSGSFNDEEDDGDIEDLDFGFSSGGSNLNKKRGGDKKKTPKNKRRIMYEYENEEPTKEVEIIKHKN